MQIIKDYDEKLFPRANRDLVAWKFAFKSVDLSPRGPPQTGKSKWPVKMRD